MSAIKITYRDSLVTECKHPSGAVLRTEAPENLEKGAQAFSPTDLFATSLASCMLTMMAVEARRLHLSLEGAEAEVEKQMSDSGPRRIVRLLVRIRSVLEVDPFTQKRLETAALNCPIHYSLHPDIKIELGFVWGL